MTTPAADARALELAETLRTRLTRFSWRLRGAGIGVTTGRFLDALRSLLLVRLEVRSDVRLALRTNLVSSREEEELFDRLFDELWDESARPDGSSTQGEGEGDDAEVESAGASPNTAGAGSRPEGTRFGRGQVDSRKDLAALWPGGSAELERTLRDLARRLATRRSRRFRPARRGTRLDLRRSLRRGVGDGISLVRLLRRERKILKTRLVLLCDVSGSMDRTTPFVLQLMFALQHRLAGSRTAVFSTGFTEVTAALRGRGVEATFAAVSMLARHWSGGTDIGGALMVANRRLFGGSSPSSTVALVVSDGFDEGDPARIAHEMALLARRTRRILWVNPLLAREADRATSRGMRAAAPWVDRFLPAKDVAALRRLVGELRRI